MREIIVNVDKMQNKTIMIVENGKLIEHYEQSKNYTNIEGNIYLGKVQNIFQGMQAAFIDIGEDKNTFIHLKDILPKIDTKKNNNTNEDVINKDIKKYIKTGDPILVQVKRSSYNTKGARVSTHINLPGKHLVLLPNTSIVTISQKIEDEKEKNRLLDIIKKNLPENMGAIVRTSAINKTENEIIKDIKSLVKTWNGIEEKLKDKKIQSPILLYKSNDIIKTILIDMIDKDIEKVMINNEKMLQELEDIKESYKVEIDYKNGENLLDIYGLDEQIEKLNNRKIHLKCGGFITIDKTEALTAVDVNSGKYTGKKDLEQTIYTVNKEATLEIAKQIRLRDIGGVIVIDYIDMQDKDNKKDIEKLLKEELKKDRSKTQVLGFTKLNLLEMTRKKVQG